MNSQLSFINTHSSECLDEIQERDLPRLRFGNKIINQLLYEIHEGFWKNRPIALFSTGDENVENVKTYMNASKQYQSNESLNSMWSDDYNRCFVVNNDKKEYINLNEYAALWERDTRYITHPLPMLLCINKEAEEIGGVNIEHALKGHWANDRFSVCFEKLSVPADFRNITPETLFYPLPDKYDEFQRKTLEYSCRMDTEVRERLARDLDSNASKLEVIENLKASQSAFIKFKKVDGTIVERRATLDENYTIDEDQLNTKYLWFYDLDEGIGKKFVFEGFRGLTIDEI